MRIIISSTLDVPIYEQIRTQLKDAILSGEIKDGEILPSIRHLAAELRVSVITTNRAYEELEKEGLIYAVKGKGYYVSLNHERVREEYMYRIEQQILAAIDYSKAAGIEKEEFVDLVKHLIEKEFLYGIDS